MEELKELSFVEKAYTILSRHKKTMPFRDIMNQISSMQGLTKEQINSRIAQCYTDINIDGRFMTGQDNQWGLKSWYAVDQMEEEIVITPKVKKKKGKKVVDEVLEGFDEVEVEEEYDEFLDEDIDDLVEDELDDDLEDLDEEEDDELDEIEEIDEDFEIEKEEEERMEISLEEVEEDNDDEEEEQ